MARSSSGIPLTPSGCRSASFTISRLLRFCFIFTTLFSTVSAQRKQPLVVVDPFKDPKNDVLNPLRYIPSNVLTAIAVSLILIVALLQTLWIFKWGAKWMMAMTIGAYCFALGIGFRFGLHSNPHSDGIYIAEYLFVTLSPCAFIAADYVLLGRLARHLDADKHLLISSRRLTAVFITSDVVTFLTQAAGGGITTSRNNLNNQRIGPKIFLAGLAAQLASFAAFSAVFAVFLYRIYTKEKPLLRIDGHKAWYSRWTALAGALVLSCIGILIRSCFRTAELSQGFGGALARSEGLFYGLDTLPLFIATAIYIPFWPGRFIDDHQPLRSPGIENTVTGNRRGSSDSVSRTMVELGQVGQKPTVEKV
ncbi:RTA1 like protein-domain-containing protein [Crepidotus variabilis]|uniref:RTA1 like protein-domain-containing protein n=1 Tax=Crepidotus variabilis TaxID=179855 RepID=A0A9P6ERV8_9AGAR|nr:RTA1 like protein-domain-containing protein [Crepidotus variabilis]